MLITLAIVIWWNSQFIIRWFDPIAATDDAGMVQRILFAMVAFLFFHAFIKLYMRICWPQVDKYLAVEFRRDFKSIGTRTWLKLLLSSLLYALFLIVLALLY